MAASLIKHWLEAAGITHERFIDVVRGTVTDGQICKWVRTHTARSDEIKARVG